ncbi:MAG TPA: exosortase B [Usitatibacter sp.]|nr:exosortase B [Usitatibacter sp.]
MSTVLEERALSPVTPQGAGAWIAVLAGLAALYIPTYLELARGLWRDDAYAHGPIVVAVFAWLVWRRRAILLDASSRPAPVSGALSLAAGLALYLLGRTQSLTVFEVASHIPVIAGAVLMLRGIRGLRALAFPILFLCFLVPLPGFILDALTAPLKGFVSMAVELLLSALGYPVERAGVVLDVGGIQMLVADACSGLNSIYSLFALGLLYTQVSGRPTPARTAIIVASIVPIAVAANILRVLFLVLVTYHFGADASRGWLHDVAGMLVFVSALLMVVGLDKLVVPAKAGTQGTTHARSGWIHASAGRTLATGVAIGLLMAGTALAVPSLKPVAAPGPAVDLESVIPTSFAGWRLDPDEAQVAVAPDVQARLDRLYRQIVSRTYVNAQGERMMVTVAHGGDQSDALKAHRQEVCYSAQGFTIHRLAHGELSSAGRTIPVTRFVAVQGERVEPVTYWFTMGDRVVLGRVERLRVQLENGFAGRIPDGMLVRVSSLSADPAAAFASQQSFVSALTAAVPAGEAARFVGARRG